MIIFGSVALLLLAIQCAVAETFSNDATPSLLLVATGDTARMLPVRRGDKPTCDTVPMPPNHGASLIGSLAGDNPGLYSCGGGSRQCKVLDRESLTWKDAGNPCPEVPKGQGAVLFGTQMWMVGTESSDGSVLTFDGKECKKINPSIPGPFTHHPSCISGYEEWWSGKKQVFFLGDTGSARYLPARQMWIRMPNLSPVRTEYVCGHQSSNPLIVAGGQDSEGHPTALFDVFKPAKYYSGYWFGGPEFRPGTTLGSPRYSAFYTPYEHSFIIAGGYDAQGKLVKNVVHFIYESLWRTINEDLDVEEEDQIVALVSKRDVPCY